MSKFSYLSDYNLPWLKSATFKLLINLLKPGLYLFKKKWSSHGFYVSVTEGNVSLTLFTLRLGDCDVIKSENYERKTQTNLLPITDFLLEFFDKYTFYDKNIINVYDTIYHGYIFINQLNKTLLWEYEDLYNLNENKYTIHYCGYVEEMLYNVTVEENNDINTELSTLTRDFVTKKKIEPMSLESYVLNVLNVDSTIDDKKCICKLKLEVTQENYIVIHKEAFFFSRPFVLKDILSPNIYKMLQINK